MIKIKAERKHFQQSWFELEGLTNCSYKIKKQIPLAFNSGCVLAKNEKTKELVTWDYYIELKEDSFIIIFNCGHYTSDLDKAFIDLYERTIKSLEYDITWHRDRISYNIKNDILD